MKLEELFGMETGYVLGFSDRTFGDFVYDSTGKELYDEAGTYSRNGTSKANRLRSFWRQEPNHIAGKLTRDLVDSCSVQANSKGQAQLHAECVRIAARLLQSAPVLELDAIAAVSAERDFKVLANSVKASIENNEPEAGLDRLHTYVTRLVRTYATARGVDCPKDKPLHSVFGEYVRALRHEGHIATEMAERILRSSISTLEAFNKVRNDRSLAHDNELLHYDEALFIYNHVCSLARYLRALEAAQPA